MSELDAVRKVKNKVELQLLKIPGVTGVDIGRKIVQGKETDTLAIRVYVESKREVPQDELIPASIDGIPTDVIERRFILHSD